MNNGGVYDSKTLYVGNLDHQVLKKTCLDHDQNDNSYGDHDGDHDDLDHNGHGNGTTSHYLPGAFQPWPWH